MNLPHIIDHSNLRPLLDALQKEPCYQCGSKTPVSPDDWHQQMVVLEFPTGEACDDGLKTLALVGKAYYDTTALTGREGFDAQGLEGKVQIRKPLFGALMNLRDLLQPGRGRIVVDLR